MKFPQLLRAGAVVGLAAAPLLSHASGIDVTAVTSGISDAQTAITTVITGLMGLSVAIFGLAKVYSFVKRRAGA